MERLIDRRGKFIGFDGHLVSHGRQMPSNYIITMTERKRSSLLPSLLWGSHELISYEPGRYGLGDDPYVLYDRWGAILYEWPKEYEPNWIEVREVCQQLGLI